MKRKTILLLFAFVATIAKAQITVTIPLDYEQGIAVDTVAYSIGYKFSFVNDTKKQPRKPLTAQMTLDVGKRVAAFRSDEMIYADSVNVEIYRNGEMGKVATMGIGNVSWSLFADYPSPSRYSYLERFGMDRFVMAERVPAPNWTIINDSVTEILSYKCRLATATFMGRKWSAWFAEEIPIERGPWLLNGLPGLILRAYDDNDEFRFEANALTNGNGSVPIYYKGGKYETLSKEKLAETYRRYYADPVGYITNNPNVKVKVMDKNGNETEPDRGIPYNLIDATMMKKGKTDDNTASTTDIPTLKGFTLREINVKSHRAYARQDTINYDLSRYADARDNTLKDVLKKLPGVDIDNNGQISFNGKAISRFTVEDLDLTGGRYDKLNETLKAEDVARAEVIEHDQPKKALQGKVATDDVAMNIKLKDGARDRIATTLRPSIVVGGNPTIKPQGGIDLLQIGKKRQRMYDAKYDQSGNNIARQEDILAKASLASDNDEAKMPQWFSLPPPDYPISAERMRMNESWSASIKETRKNSKGNEQRITAGYQHIDEEQTIANNTTYFLSSDNIANTTETADNRLKKDKLYIDFNQRVNNSRVYGNEYLIAEASRNRSLSSFSLGNNDLTHQRIVIPELHLANTFSRLWRNDRHAWEFLSNIDVNHSPSAMTINGNEQKLYTTMLHTDESATLTLFRPFLTHRYTLSVSSSLVSSEQRVVSSEPTATKANNGEAPLLTTHYSLLTIETWQYRRGKLRLQLDIPSRLSVFTSEHKQYVDASPSAFVNIVPNNHRELWANAGFRQSSGGWKNIVLREWQSNYRTFTTSDGTIQRTGILHATLGYNYKRTLSEFFSAVTIGYSRSFRNTMTDMNIVDGNYQLSIVGRDNISTAFTARAAVSKGFFKLNSKTKLNVSYSHIESSQLSSGIVSDYSSNVLAINPEIKWSPSFGTFAYSANFTLNRLETAASTSSTLFDWVQTAKYIHSIGNVDLAFAATHYRNELQDGTTANAFLADASIILRLKSVRLSAIARNLFNRHAYTLTTYSDTSISTTNYTIRPREIVVEAQISI